MYTLLSMSYKALCDLASTPLTSSGRIIPSGGSSYGLGSTAILPLPVESSDSWLVSCLFRPIREHPAFLQPAAGSLLGDLECRAKGHERTPVRTPTSRGSAPSPAGMTLVTSLQRCLFLFLNLALLPFHCFGEILTSFP